MKHLEINNFKGLEEAIKENTVNGEVVVTLDGVDKYVMLDIDKYESLLDDLLLSDPPIHSIPSDVDLRVECIDQNGIVNLNLSSEEYEELKEKVVEALEKRFKPNTKYN